MERGGVEASRGNGGPSCEAGAVLAVAPPKHRTPYTSTPKSSCISSISGVHKIGKPGKHLPRNAPEILAVKEFVVATIRDGKAHPLLVGNFAQVWTCMYEPAARAIWKDPKRQGQQRDPARKPGKFFHRAQLAKQLRVDLGLEAAALLGNREKGDDGYSQIGCVSNWRTPRTTTTLSWRNGDLGRLFITVAYAKISEAQLKEAEGLRGYAHVERPHSNTHMWRGETTVRYLHFLTTELKHRRKRYGLRESYSSGRNDY